jgi:hypothetical protein
MNNNISRYSLTLHPMRNTCGQGRQIQASRSSSFRTPTIKRPDARPRFLPPSNESPLKIYPHECNMEHGKHSVCSPSRMEMLFQPQSDLCSLLTRVNETCGIFKRVSFLPEQLLAYSVLKASEIKRRRK